MSAGQAIGFGDAKRLSQRQPKYRKTIGHADAKMNAKRGGRHQPTIEIGLGDDALFGEQAAVIFHVPS